MHISPFYINLTKDGKEKFIQRINTFLNKKIITYHFDIGPFKTFAETVIASNAIQLTWGLQDFTLSEYKFISIFQGFVDHSLNVKKGISGLKNQTFINFSWRQMVLDFVEKTNSVLDVWIYYLTKLAEKNSIWDEFFIAYYKVWCDAARNYLHITSSKTENIFNYSEKLPLVIQQFFSNPKELSEFHPEIYEHTKKLLNIDILDGQEYDFIYSEELATKKKSRSNNRAIVFGAQDSIRKFGAVANSSYFAILLFPVAIGIWYEMGKNTYIGWIFSSIFILTLIGFILFTHQYFYTKRGISLRVYLVMLAIGGIPFVYSVLTTFNYLIPIKRNNQIIEFKHETELYKHLPSFLIHEPKIKTIEFANNEDGSPMDSTMIHMYDTYTQGVNKKAIIPLLDSNDEIVLDTYTGIFGGEVFDGYRIIIKK